MWLLLPASVLSALSLTAMAAGSAETPHTIQTFRRVSPREQSFDRRAAWLRAFGMLGLSGAAALSVFAVLR